MIPRPDVKWNFRAHFAWLVPRVLRAAMALRRLMPNMVGPCAHARRLYLGVVRSMALYGAPVWANALDLKDIRTNEIRNGVFLNSKSFDGF